MNGNQLSVDDLNAKRRQAVRLRLQGEKLAVVTASTGLSSPTVIAAVKAYRQGGWSAVEVSPRQGRPPKAEEGMSLRHVHALVQAMLAGPPDVAGLPHALWNRKAIGDWLARQPGARSSPGAVTRLCQALDLDFDDGSLGSPESTPEGWMRCHGVERYLPAWPGVPADSGKIGLLCVKGVRGQLLWLAFSGPLEARHYLALLTRLFPRRTPLELAIPGSARLLRVAELSEWLDAQPGALRLIDPELGAPTSATSNTHIHSAPVTRAERTAMPLTHLQRLEAESIHIMREVVAETDKPVMLYSVGKDSAVMLHLAMKAFYPSRPPFPLLHVDTRWKFRDMYSFRDRMVKELGLELITHVNPEGIAKNINPFTHGSAIHTDIMKTEGLKQALDKYSFDAAFGGARRDEEKSRAKERIFSFRSTQHRWDPKNQRPELWKIYNTRKHKGESLRVFPLSNWTELDIWQYIYLQDIPIVPLYYAAQRPVVERNGTLIMVDDARMPLGPGEVPMMRKVRFRTLGCYPLTGAIESEADTLPAIIQEMLLTRTSERQGRVIDHDSAASMEKKKQEGYF
ncbi:MAG: cysD [Ramlibacter sp.]|nr:cysD [Ramlibacter sp.]